MTGYRNSLEDGHLLVSLGMTSDGRMIWPIAGADGSEDDDADADDDGDDDDTDDQDDDGDGADKSKKDKSKKDDKKDDDEDDVAFWHARADRFKSRMEAADRRATAAERENVRLKAGKDDALDEHGKQDLKDAVARASKAEDSLGSLRLKVAILSDTTFAWEDPELVLAALASDDTVEIDEDGKVVGVKQALKSLAKHKPFLVKKAVAKDDPKDDDDAEDDDDEDEEPPKKRTSGNPSNGPKRKSQVPDRKTLTAKYPALGRR